MGHKLTINVLQITSFRFIVAWLGCVLSDYETDDTIPTGDARQKTCGIQLLKKLSKFSCYTARNMCPVKNYNRRIPNLFDSYVDNLRL